MFESTVKAVQRDLYVAQVHGIVSFFANHLKLLVTYGDIASALEGTPRGGQLAQALAAITEADHKAKKPLTTTVVVNSHASKPGSGFFAQCRQLGYEVGSTEKDEEDFWLSQLQRLKVAPHTLTNTIEVSVRSEAPFNDLIHRIKLEQQDQAKTVGFVHNATNKRTLVEDPPQTAVQGKSTPLSSMDLPTKA